MKWTNSALLKLLQCPEAYRRIYLEREWRPSSPGQIRGDAVHQAQRIEFQSKMATGVLPPLEEVRTCAADHFDKKVKDSELVLTAEDLEDSASHDLKKILGVEKDTAVALAGLHWRRVAPAVNPVAFERQIVVKPRGLDIEIQGTLDLIDAPAPGVEVIRDLKTAKKSPDRQAAHKSQQMSVYAMLRLVDIGRLPDHLRLDYLVRTPARGDLKDIALTTTRDATDVQTLIDRLNIATDVVKAGKFLPAPEGAWWCLSPETEILTRAGWKDYPRLTDSDLFLTLNQTSGLFEWQRAQMIFAKPWARRMVRYSGRTLSFSVTPDHRMLVRNVGGTYTRRVPAADIECRGSLHYPTAAYLWREGVKLPDDWLALSGWLSAEGHFRSDSAMIEISQRRDSSNWLAIETLLAQLGLHYSIRPPSGDGVGIFRILSEDAAVIRETLQPSKAIPPWLWDADERQFRVWLATFANGDGHREPRGVTLTQKSEAFIDELQALCLSQRMTANKTSRMVSSTGGEFWRLYVHDQMVERELGGGAGTKDCWLTDTTAEWVWCVTVPNGTIVTRLDGKPIITGNCDGRYCAFHPDAPGGDCKYAKRGARPEN